MMNIKEYLFFERVKLKDLAEALDMSVNHISGIANGRYNPSRKLAKKIYKETEGKVDLRDERDKL